MQSSPEDRVAFFKMSVFLCYFSETCSWSETVFCARGAALLLLLLPSSFIHTNTSQICKQLRPFCLSLSLSYRPPVYTLHISCLRCVYNHYFYISFPVSNVLMLHFFMFVLHVYLFISLYFFSLFYACEHRLSYESPSRLN